MYIKKDDQRLVEHILEYIDEHDELPWTRPHFYKGQMNVLTGQSYSGANAFRLAVVGMLKGVPPYWGTFLQAKKAGGYVKRGEKAMAFLLRPHTITIEAKDDSEEAKTFVRYSAFSVFNISQMEGVEAPTEMRDNPTIPEFESIIENMPNPPGINRAGNAPVYSPKLDIISIPALENTVSSNAWYQMGFHELVHSTGHETRLNRDMTGSKSSTKYAEEEVIAEMGSLILMNKFSIPADIIKNSAAYIKGWSKRIRKQPSIFTQLVTQA
ncbi:MAG: zincin-like metallopeptidase domain-containing protein, partial [Euryarchaeota archaeon]|nr:zincin-like metallopeptidase domain-containing protein [Euryarchaeota archaeon]